jgi:hypothetical protein
MVKNKELADTINEVLSKANVDEKIKEDLIRYYDTAIFRKGLKNKFPNRTKDVVPNKEKVDENGEPVLHKGMSNYVQSYDHIKFWYKGELKTREEIKGLSTDEQKV